MDHDRVVREKMTEKYLLEELGPELRDEFEEHFFECPECAKDIRAGSDFVAHSKIILADRSEAVAAAHTAPAQESDARGWFAWLRLAFAVPAFAILLVVVGYQNLVTLPRLLLAASQPQVLPAATVNLLTYGANASPLIVHTGEGFLLNVIVPPGHHYPTYKVDVYNPAGKLEASVAIPESADDTWPIRFPGASRVSGTYSLKVYGLNQNGENAEVGSGSFELQVQK